MEFTINAILLKHSKHLSFKYVLEGGSASSLPNRNDIAEVQFRYQLQMLDAADFTSTTDNCGLFVVRFVPV